MSPRRPMKRIGDMLPDLAANLGIDGELRLARQMADVVALRHGAATGVVGDFFSGGEGGLAATESGGVKGTFRRAAGREAGAVSERP